MFSNITPSKKIPNLIHIPLSPLTSSPAMKKCILYIFQYFPFMYLAIIRKEGGGVDQMIKLDLRRRGGGVQRGPKMDLRIFEQPPTD